MRQGRAPVTVVVPRAALVDAGSANGPKTHARQDDPSLGAELGHLDLLGPMLAEWSPFKYTAITIWLRLTTSAYDRPIGSFVSK
jgi:hypothetical protein